MLNTFKIGDGVIWNAGSDLEAGTVVAVTPKTVSVVLDEAELLNGIKSGADDALTFDAGGYFGHMDGDQRYRFSRGTGEPIKFSWRSRLNEFKKEYTSTNGSMRSWGILRRGRSKHYDYNF